MVRCPKHWAVSEQREVAPCRSSQQDALLLTRVMHVLMALLCTCRKSLCIELLSPGIVALHEAAVPVGYKTAAIFWHDLWVAATNLNSVQWWQHGAQELKNNVAKVCTIRLSFTAADDTPPDRAHHLMWWET